MRTSDKRFIELSRRNTQQPTVRVTLDMTSGNIVLGSADIQSVTVTRSINGGSFCTGGTESASMELKVFASSMPAVPETAAYIVELGYVDDDGTAHWADFGTFATNTENVVRDGLWMTVTGYDAFYWMDTEGYDFGTASGKTALSTRSMMASIAKGTSIKYTASEWSDSNLWLYRPSGTKREQIGQLAAANCANAVMSGADKVTLRVPTETGIALTPNDYAVGGFSVTTETALPVSKVKATFKRTYDYDSSSDYSRQGDESIECSYPETSNGLAIELDESLFADGEFADETLLQKAKNDLSAIASTGAKNGGLGTSFRGFDATLFGCCFLEPLDILTVTDHYGDTHTVCVLSASWAYDGGIKTTLSASASAEDTSASSSSNSVSKIASQLETVQGGVLALQRLTVDTLRGDNATFNSVIADKLTATDAKITNLLADKADIDLLNVNNGWIENGVIKEGAITKATIHDGAITTAKIADASITAEKVHDLNADSITTGKLKTQYIILTDDDGETQSVISALNAKAESSEGGVLDGAIVQDESIEAAKISVADLKAFEATIGSFDIDDTSIHNGKSSINDPTPGVYVGTTGIGVGDGSYSGGGIPDGKAYYTDDNGAYLSTTDYATYSEDSDGGIAVLADEYSGWAGSVAAVYGVKSCPFEVYADGTVKIKGTNGSIEFDAVSGELDINATKLSIKSSTVATESSVEYSVGDMKEQIVGSDGTGGIVQQQIKSFDSDLTQANVFNRLTNNGAAQGIYLENGNLYVNASYIASGTYSIKNSAGDTVVKMGSDIEDGIQVYDPYTKILTSVSWLSFRPYIWVPVFVKSSSSKSYSTIVDRSFDSSPLSFAYFSLQKFYDSSDGPIVYTGPSGRILLKVFGDTLHKTTITLSNPSAGAERHKSILEQAYLYISVEAVPVDGDSSTKISSTGLSYVSDEHFSVRLDADKTAKFLASGGSRGSIIHEAIAEQASASDVTIGSAGKAYRITTINSNLVIYGNKCGIDGSVEETSTYPTSKNTTLAMSTDATFAIDHLLAIPI